MTLTEKQMDIIETYVGTLGFTEWDEQETTIHDACEYVFEEICTELECTPFELLAQYISETL